MAQEAKIETAVCKYAKEQGCYVRKFKSSNQRGVPDRLFITPSGVVFFIEFKAPGKKPSDLQRRELNLIESNGGNAEYADSIESGKSWVNFYMGYIGAISS